MKELETQKAVSYGLQPNFAWTEVTFSMETKDLKIETSLTPDNLIKHARWFLEFAEKLKVGLEAEKSAAGLRQPKTATGRRTMMAPEIDNMDVAEQIAHLHNRGLSDQEIWDHLGIEPCELVRLALNLMRAGRR